MRHSRRWMVAGALLLGALGFMEACGGGTASATSPSDATGSTAGSTSGLPAMYAHFHQGVQVSLSGVSVVLRSNDVPDHKSPYFPTSDARYEPPRAGMILNPFRILSQDFQFSVPANPRMASSPSSTNLGPIGLAVNGVALFNQYAAGFQPLDDEVRTFDQHNGHPQQQGAYHYHFEPITLTGGDPTALVGVLLDGFPVYGPKDVGGATPNDLDECNGHTGVTPDHPQGTYHYHTTAAFPYISGCYRGTPGRGTN